MSVQEPQSKCIARIRSSYSQFSEKEKLIADYILTHPEEIIHLTINQFSEKLGIADATVFRFCKRIGFKGYQAMKIALASDIMTSLKDIHETINEHDSEIQIAQKVFSSNIRTLENSLHLIDENVLTKSVNALLKARKIEFYGTGGSGFIALDAHHKFLRTGITTTAYTDSHMQLMSVSQLTEQDVVIFISHSGSNKDLLEVHDTAKEKNIFTIAITNFAKSPLSQRADLSLYTVSEETDYRSEALSSRIAQLSIIDTLYVNVMIHKSEAKVALQNMREAMSIKRM